MEKSLVNYLKKGGLILTPSQRLASSVKQKASLLIAQFQSHWTTPRVYALDDWFDTLWEKCEIKGFVKHRLLSEAQSLLRLEEIVQQQTDVPFLINTYETAKIAFQAWNYLYQYCVSEYLFSTSDNIDHGCFIHWCKLYQQWLSQNHYIDKAMLISNFQELFLQLKQDNIEIIEDQKIVLWGFLEPATDVLNFFDCLAQNGIHTLFYNPEEIKSENIVRRVYSTQEEELQAVAQWAYSLKRQGEHSIGIVVPQLADVRDDIEMLFKDTFNPLQACQTQNEVVSDFNISAATPLLQYPLIYAAVNLLKLALEPVTVTTYLSCLVSPFTSEGIKESEKRAIIAKQLKGIAGQKWQKQEILTHLKGSLSTWHQLIQNFYLYTQGLTTNLLLSQWLEHFKVLLEIMGWPGERHLNSIEYQVVKRWYALLAELNQYDFILGEISFAKALSVLQKLASHVPFQAENKGATVQVLGLVEAQGQQFEHLWVLGLNNESWPLIASANPFLPLALQKKHKMPHASPEREMEYAQRVTENFKHSAKNITLSYYTQDKGRTLDVSELIRQIPQDINILTSEKNARHTYYVHAAKTETLYDEKAPKLTNDEMISAGSQVLTLQAQCPFKAFAEIRLKATRLSKREFSLAPVEQGIVLHQLLEHFWTEVKTQHNLMQLGDKVLNKKIEYMIDLVLEKKIKALPVSYVEVEKFRLKSIFLEYLDLEKSRPPFKVVSLEKESNICIDSLELTLRLDRIDQNESHEHFIVDYKTGKFNALNMWGERPKSPQMPLYYLASYALNPQALIFIKMNSQRCEYDGISHLNVGIEGLRELTHLNDSEVPTDWNELHAYWLQRLTPIVNDFRMGIAKVDPIDGEKTCQYCQLKSFCRVNEREIA